MMQPPAETPAQPAALPLALPAPAETVEIPGMNMINAIPALSAEPVSVARPEQAMIPPLAGNSIAA